MSDTLVQYEVEGRAARLTLDSPHNRNALSSGLVRQLREGLQGPHQRAQWLARPIQTGLNHRLSLVMRLSGRSGVLRWCRG